MTQEKLEAKIAHLNEQYRIGNPECSDAEYDELIDTLQKLFPNSKLLASGVIEEKPVTNKVELPQTLFSLNKVKTFDEIIKWLDQKGVLDDEFIVITPKFNGISVYVDLSVLNLFTRGDGVTGQDCSKHLLEILKNGNNKVFEGWKSPFRAEAIISKKNWERHFKGKEINGKVYKLNNSTVAGMLNSINIPDSLSYVDLMPYELFNGQSKINQLYEINRNLLNNNTYNIFVTKRDLSLEVLDEFYELQKDLYPIDGLVLTINDVNKYQPEINGNPGHSRALKLEKWTSEHDVTIKGFEYQMSKQGKLKGIVSFDPIEIEGSEVKAATFNNARFIYDMKLRPGVKITIKKSGDIIPKIVAVNGRVIPLRQDYKNEKSFKQDYNDLILEREFEDLEQFSSEFNISVCPSCGSDLFFDNNEVDLVCKNHECPDVVISKLEHFFSTIGMEEMGRPTIKAFYDYGFKTSEDIFELSAEQISRIEGFGTASAKIITSQFDKIYTEGLPMARIMYAYDVFDGQLGEKTIQLIFDNCFPGGVESLPEIPPTVDELIKIDGISYKTAEFYLNGFKAFLKEFKFLPVTYIKTPAKTGLNKNLTGKNICFSGVRDKQTENLIELCDGKVVSGVSKKTTHLIVADVDQMTAKTEKAREYGCEIISLTDFKIKYLAF